VGETVDETVDESVERRARVHAALADPVRLGIVEELALSDRSPTELGERFGVRSNLLAHHLDVLEASGVIDRVVSRGDGRRRYVRLVPGALGALLSAPMLRAAGVVFVCTRNSARSPLAAALWNARSPIEATSAGTDPAHHVHPEAVRAARRHDLDLEGAVPSPLDVTGLAGRLVVTVCDLAREELAASTESTSRAGMPVVLHWSVADPAESGAPAAFDDVVHVLERRVQALVPSVSPS
jgi:protein-tyrosine-phosphatase/DNA-binding HxlR family transcriptional regulator